MFMAIVTMPVASVTVAMSIAINGASVTVAMSIAIIGCSKIDERHCPKLVANVDWFRA
jgi:hypothetical protein